PARAYGADGSTRGCLEHAAYRDALGAVLNDFDEFAPFTTHAAARLVPPGRALKSWRIGASGPQPCSPSVEDLREGAKGVLLRRETGLRSVGQVDRAAVQATEEVIEEPLARCRVIEDVPDQRGLRRLLDEVAEALRGLIEALQEECVAGGVAHGELRGMQIPALIEAAVERVTDVTRRKLPRAVDDLLV